MFTVGAQVELLGQPGKVGKVMRVTDANRRCVCAGCNAGGRATRVAVAWADGSGCTYAGVDLVAVGS